MVNSPLIGGLAFGGVPLDSHELMSMPRVLLGESLLLLTT